MTEQEFYENPPEPKAKTSPVENGRVPIIVAPGHDRVFEDEVLPDNVFKVYAGGQICYMTSTEDGRIVRLDDWAMPGILD